MNSIDTTTPSTVASTGPVFFSVSVPKLLVMTICTLGFYQIYWFYRNWIYVKQRERTDISPVWRSIFKVIFCYSFFRRVKDSATANGIAAAPPSVITVAWIVFLLLAYLPKPYFLLTFCAGVILLPIQNTVNSINAGIAPHCDSNSRYSAWNIAIILLGGGALLLAMVGALIGPQA
jgi:hypothetical protein